jgi:hypothetical protein
MSLWWDLYCVRHWEIITKEFVNTLGTRLKLVHSNVHFTRRARKLHALIRSATRWIFVEEKNVSRKICTENETNNSLRILFDRLIVFDDRLCGLVVRVRGSIPGVARFSWAAVGLELGPLSLVNNLRSYLEEKVAAPGLENRSYGRRD